VNNRRRRRHRSRIHATDERWLR